MHESALDKFGVFISTYLERYHGIPLSILDIGSCDIGGDGERASNHRAPIIAHGWKYLGLDIENGPNVDLVVKNSYHYAEIDDCSHDVVLCSQVLEHARYPWLLVSEIARVLKPNGLAFLIAPSSGHVHRYPEDCYRYYPDGLSALGEAAGLVVIDSHVHNRPVYRNNIWLDATAVLQKPVLPPELEGRMQARRHLARLSAEAELTPKDLEAVNFVAPASTLAPFERLEPSLLRGAFAQRDEELAKRFDPLRRLEDVRRHFSKALKALTRPL